jgi:hypothetical protein
MAAGGITPHRTWLAIVELQQDQPLVRVFHQAIYPYPGEQADAYLKVGFQPTWVQLLDSGQGWRTLLVGGRNGPGIRPWCIDPDTLKVSVGGIKCNELQNHSRTFSAHRNRLFQATQHDVWLWDLDNEATAKSERKAICRTGGPGYGTPELDCMLLPYRGKLYVPGDTWFSIDPETLESERLVPSMLPKEHRFRVWGVSAHYGLFGWKDWGHFYRIQVSSDNAVQSRPAQPQ